jgi:hypothetical protein
MTRWQLQLLMIAAAGAGWSFLSAQDAGRQWLAGDSHIHSHWSAGYDHTANPPKPSIGLEGRYATPVNARQAQRHGLDWMVTTDHGGPNHSKLNFNLAHAELEASREIAPGILQFYGMELNLPGMDHHTLIIPNSKEEASVLFEIESRFDSQEAWPPDPARYREEHARRALEHMKSLPLLPLLFANHPSRTAAGIGIYGLDEPRELRNHHDLAPEVYRGMEGAPGRQADTLAADGSQKQSGPGRPDGFRGGYETDGAHTLGGFDQMTAIVGGLWDSMLGEGRRFWILAASDSHAHYSDQAKPGSDFWPGEFQKTYVHAQRSYQGVLDGLRSGRIFAVAGDLINELDVTAKSGTRSAGIGGTLSVGRGRPVALTVRFRDPRAQNARGENPQVSRVDVIVGEIHGAVADRNSDRNPSTKVVARFTEKQWARDGEVITINTTLPRTERSIYVRVRGTNTQDLEPPMDVQGENPWADLWFYSNPVFVEISAPAPD